MTDLYNKILDIIQIYWEDDISPFEIVFKDGRKIIVDKDGIFQGMIPSS